ncbi:Metallo-dependent hydrolase, partial [Nadsonia fulvescens var. elongata DSM 6958]
MTVANILKKTGLRTIFHGTFIHTPKLGELEILPKTSIGVDLNGKIKFIERETTAQQSITKHGKLWIDAKIVETSKSTSFFFPGFFDTHIHAPQFPNNGIFGNSTLLDWLTTYTFPLEASLSDTERAKLVYQKCIERTLSHGTTSASYYATIHVEATKVLADLALKLGQRALIGRVCMDQNTPDYYRHNSVQEAYDSDMAVINYISEIDTANEFIAPIITPRFAPACSMEVMKMQSKLAKDHNLHIQTHISENPAEINWVSKLFPESENYADVYRQAGLLTKKTILAHAIHLTQKEKDVIKEHQCGISHCPISNSSITSGECHVKDLLRQNIKVGLGSDVSGGFAPSIL